MPRFKDMPMHPSQILMFSQSVEEAVPADSDVRVLSEVMDSLDWSVLERSYSETGRPAYPPRVLAKMLAYAYSKGMRSSRKIEEFVENDKRYIWLAGGLTPDHNTLARFRLDKWAELTELYKDSVRVCAEAGLVFLNVVSVDGSKLQAKSSRKAIYDDSRVAREMAAVEKVLQEAEETDRLEDEKFGASNGREVPEELKDTKKRKAKLEEISKRLKESKRKNVVASEPDSRVMKTKGGRLPSYNLEAAVDSENQIIVGMQLTQGETDHGQLPQMVTQVEANTGLSPDIVLGDSGFSDEETLKWVDEREQEALIAPKEHPQERKRNDLFCSRCFLAAEDKDALICPAGRELRFQGEFRTGSGTYRQYGATGCQSCSFYRECVGERGGSRRVSVSTISRLREHMREKLKSAEGKATFALRKQTVEPVFGQIKRNMGFDRFLAGGLAGATAETALICLVHNLLKCGRKAHITADLLLHRVAMAFILVVRHITDRFPRHNCRSGRLPAWF